MSEAEIQRDIIDYLKARKYTVVRVNSGKVKARNGFVQLADPGTPDLLAISRRGEHVWVEVKKDTGKLSHDQIEWIAEHRTRGCTVLVARSVEEVAAVIK